jgi:hypothetical protein
VRIFTTRKVLGSRRQILSEDIRVCYKIKAFYHLFLLLLLYLSAFFKTAGRTYYSLISNPELLPFFFRSPIIMCKTILYEYCTKRLGQYRAPTIERCAEWQELVAKAKEERAMRQTSGELSIRPIAFIKEADMTGKQKKGKKELA